MRIVFLVVGLIVGAWAMSMHDARIIRVQREIITDQRHLIEQLAEKLHEHTQGMPLDSVGGFGEGWRNWQSDTIATDTIFLQK
jgi:hypothetical protein